MNTMFFTDILINARAASPAAYTALVNNPGVLTFLPNDKFKYNKYRTFKSWHRIKGDLY